MPFSKTVEKFRDIIFAAQDYIFSNPETGYKEWKTTEYLADAFEKLGYTLTKAGDIPGFYTVIDTGREGPQILVLGEMDSIICSSHPNADPKTGAAHACGHNAQCAALLGIAAALKEPNALDCLSGKIRLCAVPAEELIEIEYRAKLKDDGVIKYMGGKPEFLHRGYFDGVDIAFMLHATDGKAYVQKGNIGCISKRIIYKGAPSHAGASPWLGRNALYAATQGLSAANAIRETFKDSSMIRFHPIITEGGGAVNTIPDRVVIESQVRGSNFHAISEANRRINMALCGGALCLGANIEIQDMPGYAPLCNSEAMIELAKDAAACISDVPLVIENIVGSGCTDMGDLSMLMPVVQPYVPGATGSFHGDDFMIKNPELACVYSAKWQLEMLRLLLENGAKRAKQIIAEYKPTFSSKQEYFECIDSFSSNGNRISYNESTASIKL